MAALHRAVPGAYATRKIDRKVVLTQRHRLSLKMLPLPLILTVVHSSL